MLAIHGSKFVEQTPNISPISRNYLLGNCNRFGTAMYGLYEHRKATRVNCRGVWCGFARPVMKMRSAGATSPCRNSMLLLTLYLHICFDLPAHFMGNRIECLGGKRPDQAVADTLPGPADSLHGTGRLRRHGRVFIGCHRPCQHHQPGATVIVVHEHACRAVRCGDNPAPHEPVAGARQVRHG